MSRALEEIRIQTNRRRDGRLTLRIDLVGYRERDLAYMATAHPIVDQLVRRINRSAAAAMARKAEA